MSIYMQLTQNPSIFAGLTEIFLSTKVRIQLSVLICSIKTSAAYYCHIIWDKNFKMDQAKFVEHSL